MSVMIVPPLEAKPWPSLGPQVCDFIERHAARPFYLSLHYTAPHWPWEAPFHDGEDAVERTSGTGGGSIAIFSEMVRAMDEGIGAVMQTLRRLGLDSNTLVVFTSDNGFLQIHRNIF